MEPVTPEPFCRYRRDLPIFSCRDEIVSAIRKHPVIVVTGETGCGKTTQLPLFCLEALSKGVDARIAVTQPRRIAAVSIARRVAADLGTIPGGTAGYRTRFDECVSAQTRILFQTDGVLLTSLNRDRYFRAYNAIIIDEAHERNLNIDLLIGHLRWLSPRRHDLRVIISSATINPGVFSEAFNRAPIIRVEGRTYGIETLYDPCDGQTQSLPEAAAAAVEKIDDTGESGDILVFMPTERDIIAVKRLIDGRRLKQPSVVLPLYARLSRAHQEKLWQTTARRKIVVATNIAETSLTLPGIRFVVDSGLARIKRFQPHRRVTALPVERISRASADQRAGRCGRTGPGICIRLYDKKTYDAMESFTPAEILRSNMAGVILTLLARRLGKIDSFAFIEPPPARAVRDGFTHLRELGALDEKGSLTPAGARMARYPLDPHLARMVEAAESGGALGDVLVIAAALSCQDPRERPPDKTEAADAAHRTFADPLSDFVWYLNLWRAFHDAGRSQTRQREFCSSRFLSFMRMKEWRDVHTQIARLAPPQKAPGKTAPPESDPPAENSFFGCSYESIHTALLTGLIATIAVRDEGKKNYRMSHGGDGVLFPGSGLAKKNPPWIMFAEKVETSRLFLRSAAHIDPAWIARSAPHLVRRRYSFPHFDEESGVVRATEHAIVFGLTVSKTQVAYGRIMPAEANDIFIRDGLLTGPAVIRHGFIAHNREAVNTVTGYEAKLRVRDLYAGEEALFAFYKKQLPDATSVHDLNRSVRDQGGDSFLRISPDDLLTRPLPDEALLWPDTVTIGGVPCPCTYRFTPAEPDDGMTVHLPQGARKIIPEAMLQWLAEPLREPAIAAMFESLPKEKRKTLQPIRERSIACARKLQKCSLGFFAEAARVALDESGTLITADDLHRAAIPAHLRVHAAFDDESNAAGRALDLWKRAFAAWGKHPVMQWDFGDLPSAVSVIDDQNGLPLYGYPALEARGETVALVACMSRAEAEALHPAGVRSLVSAMLAEEFDWLGENAIVDRPDRVWIASLGDPEGLMKHAVAAVAAAFIAPQSGPTRREKEFNEHIARTRTGLAKAMRETVAAIVLAGKRCTHITGELAAWKKKRMTPAYVPVLKELALELKSYITLLASGNADYELLLNSPRYLQRLDITVTRAMSDPGRYVERMRTILPFERALHGHRAVSPALRHAARRMLEEYKISLFAQQEVKAIPGTSEKKLRELFLKSDLAL